MLASNVSRDSDSWRVRLPGRVVQAFDSSEAARAFAETEARAMAGYVHLGPGTGDEFYTFTEDGQRVDIDVPFDGAETPDGAGHPLTAQDLMAGDALLRLVEEPSRWVCRRVEEITFPDHLTFERRITLDVEMAARQMAMAPRYRGHLLLPVKTLHRGAGSPVHVLGPGAQPLLQLTRDVERRLVAAGIVATRLRATSDPIPGGPQALFGSVLARIDADPATADLDPVDDPVEVTIKAYAQDRLVTAVFEETCTDDRPDLVTRLTVIDASIVDWQWAGAEEQLDHRRGAPAESAGQGEPLAPPAGGDHDAGRGDGDAEHVLPRAGRGSPEGADPGPVPGPDGPRPKGDGSRIVEVVSRADDLPVCIPVGRVDVCQSLHIDVTAPPGTYLHTARLHVKVTEVVPSGDEDQLVTRTITVVDETDPRPDRAHIYLRRADVMEGVSPEELELSAEVRLLFRPMAAGMMRGGLYASWLSTLVLTLLAFTIGWHETGWWHVTVTGLESYGREAIVAVVLLGPTLLTSFMINRDENLMTKRLVNAFRIRLGCCTAVTFLAATTVALGVDGVGLFVVLLCTSLAAWPLTLVTTCSYRRSRSKLSDFPWDGTVTPALMRTGSAR